MARGDISTEYKAYMQRTDGRGVVDLNQMVDYILPRIDLSELSRDDLEREHLKGVLNSLLKNDKFRCVIWGNGYFVNPEHTDNECLIRIFNSARNAEKAKEKIFQMYKNMTIKNGIPGQYVYDPETGEYVPQQSDEELIKALLSDISTAV